MLGNQLKDDITERIFNKLGEKDNRNSGLLVQKSVIKNVFYELCRLALKMAVQSKVISFASDKEMSHYE